MSRRTPRLLTLGAALAITAFAAPSAHATFPGTNGTIAYTHWDDPFGNLDAPESEHLDRLTARTLAPGASTAVPITDTPKASEMGLAFSPDGTQVAWAVVGADKKVAGIYVGPASGGSGRRVAAGTTLSEPAWNASGDRIAFVTTKRGVQSVPAAGGAVTTLVAQRRGWTASGVTFSADGTRMAYTWFRSTEDSLGARNAEVWTAKPDGTEARRTIGGGSGPLELSTEPDFSPDGTSLVVVTTSPVPFDQTSIYVAAADGSSPRKIATSPRKTMFSDAAWSPDGRQLVASRIKFSGLDGREFKLKASTVLLTIDPATGVQTARLRAPKAMGFGVSWQALPAAAPPA